MNSAEQQEFDAVFGRDKLENVLRAKREKSDRWAEGAARRLGGILDDMQKGSSVITGSSRWTRETLSRSPRPGPMQVTWCRL
jgi:hypothetical protein